MSDLVPTTTDVIDILRGAAANGRMADDFAVLAHEFVEVVADRLERAKKIEAAARVLTASYGIDPNQKTAFGTEAVVVERERFDALAAALTPDNQEEAR